jgi:nucleotide-binding universal stress UspA family protein
MYLLRRILVPVDFSEASRVALEYAVFLGRRFGARVDVLHVWELNRPVWLDSGRLLKDFLARFEDDSVDVHARLESGKPLPTILEIAGDAYDLVVMSTHTKPGLSDLLHRSMAEAVVRKSPCPVVTVH